jgi:hypothetical protein
MVNKMKRFILNIVGAIAECFGWIMKWFIPNKYKEIFYHKFDTLFEDTVLMANCDGCYTINTIAIKTHLPLFIIKDSILRLQMKGFIKFESEDK